MNLIDDKFVTSPDLARSLGCSPSYIARLCRRGDIDGAFQAGTGRSSVWLIPIESAEQVTLKRRKKEN